MEKMLQDQIAKHRFLSTINSEEIENAILTLEKHISNKYGSSENYVFVTVQESEKLSRGLNLLDDLLPGLIFAHRYFGKELPPQLIQKILNKPQTSDTIFELKCMGTLMNKRKISYEPRLISGKVPEFKITPEGFPEIYVECKSQTSNRSDYMKKFNLVADKLIKSLETLAFVKDARDNGYRTEISPSKYIHDTEIKEAVIQLEKLKFSDFIDLGKLVTKNILLVCVPKQQEPKNNMAIRISSITVSDKPTRLSHENAHLMINAWEGVNIQARRSKRKLLGEARKKLKHIPKGSLGMICIQTYGASKFLPDIQKLISQKEYASIPIIWHNPFNESHIICRNEFLDLRNYLFNSILT